MREILFRGKSVKNGEWIKGYYCPAPFTHFPCKPAIYNASKIDYDRYAVEVKPETIGQYTGLKDKSGVKIFEGDILKYIDDEDNQKMLVTFEQASFMLKFNNIYPSCIISRYANRDNHIVLMAVIGNIYDDPELF